VVVVVQVLFRRRREDIQFCGLFPFWGNKNFEFFGAIFCLLLLGSFLGNIIEEKKKRREKKEDKIQETRYALQPKRRLR
tara:strand:- start:1314 stop:1550 length:237 start_codon:yes stop_codon:yes gene_type:complete